MSDGVCRSTVDTLNNVPVPLSVNNTSVFAEGLNINVETDLTPHTGGASHVASAFIVPSGYSASVFINGKPVVRIGDFSSCLSHSVTEGVGFPSTVFCG